jgi:hypothetical protein
MPGRRQETSGQWSVVRGQCAEGGTAHGVGLLRLGRAAQHDRRADGVGTEVRGQETRALFRASLREPDCVLSFRASLREPDCVGCSGPRCASPERASSGFFIEPHEML